jgi:hypothetical protein
VIPKALQGYEAKINHFFFEIFCEHCKMQGEKRKKSKSAFKKTRGGKGPRTQSSRPIKDLAAEILDSHRIKAGVFASFDRSIFKEIKTGKGEVNAHFSSHHCH